MIKNYFTVSRKLTAKVYGLALNQNSYFGPFQLLNFRFILFNPYILLFIIQKYLIRINKPCIMGKGAHWTCEVHIVKI